MPRVKNRIHLAHGHWSPHFRHMEDGPEACCPRTVLPYHSFKPSVLRMVASEDIGRPVCTSLVITGYSVVSELAKGKELLELTLIVYQIWKKRSCGET